MQDQRLGSALRVVRIRRKWRQEDVAVRARVSRTVVSMVERGHIDRTSLATVRAIAHVLDVRVDVVARWRGGELDRLLNAAHSALHESVLRFFDGSAGWQAMPEVSFSIWGERGVIDILAWHAPSRTLLVIELKTDIVDVNALVGGVDRKTRLAIHVAHERGWDPTSVSCWVIVTEDKTNQRRIEAHRTMLRTAFPVNGRTMRAWVRRPSGQVRALSTWTIARTTDPNPTRDHRVRSRVRPPRRATASGQDERTPQRR
jgi:transcriptional regulator with XRE-family HTH domain